MGFELGAPRLATGQAVVRRVVQVRERAEFQIDAYSAGTACIRRTAGTAVTAAALDGAAA